MMDSKNCTAGQLVLARMIAQGPDNFPIPGTKKIKYLKENIAACEVELTDEETKQMRSRRLR